MNTDVLEKYKLKFDDEKKRAIIDSVVAIYGEKYRGLLEERMNNIILCQYITPSHLKNKVASIKSDKADELTIRFLKQMGYDLETLDNIDKKMKAELEAYFGWNRYSPSTYSEVFSFDEVEIDECVLSNRCKLLKKLGIEGVAVENYGEYTSTPEGQVKIEEIKKALNIIKGLNQEYVGECEEEEKYLEECEKLKCILSNEGIRKYYEDIKEFLSQEERDDIEQIFEETNANQFRYLLWEHKAFFGHDITDSPLIEGFDESYDAYDKEYKMVKYFKLRGLDLGDNYSAYENNEQAQKLIPSPDVVNAIKTSRQKHAKTAEMEYFKNTGTIPEILEQLSSTEFLENVDFSRDFVEEGTICMVPNAIKDSQGQIQNKNLLFFPPLAALEEYKDIFFIHEVLHCLEGSLHEVDGQYVFSTGFEKIEIDVTSAKTVDIEQESDKNIREYELISENVHQNLAINVLQDMMLKGEVLFGGEKEQKLKGGSSYEHLNYITGSFLSKFIAPIIEARVTGDINKLKEIVGERNFEELNNVVKEYQKLPYYSMVSDLMSGKDTELTRQRDNLHTRSELIVSSMSREMNKEDGIDR